MEALTEPPALLPNVPTRAEIEHLEDAIVASSYPMLQCETRHYFADGLYAREITIPAGALLTGKVHLFEHINVVSKGAIEVWTEDGMKTLRAPFTFVSRPGTKRVGRALDETVWTTFHAHPAAAGRDPEEMENLLVEPLRPQLAQSIKEKLCLS